MIMGGSRAAAGDRRAALEPKVTYTFAAIPGLCDFAGVTAGRIGGWPKPIPKGADGKPDPTVVEATRYADGANMATMIKSPIHFYIGFVDLITPRLRICAYNVIPGPKSVENRPANGHNHDDPKFWNVVSETLIKQGEGTAEWSCRHSLTSREILIFKRKARSKDRALSGRVFSRPGTKDQGVLVTMTSSILIAIGATPERGQRR